MCLAMAFGMLLIGLWPFNYLPANKVFRLAGGNGIRFEERGLAFALRDHSRPTAGHSDEGLTLELLLRPSRYYRHSIPHILTLTDREGHEVLYFGQWKDELIVRLLDPCSWGERVVTEIGAAGILPLVKPTLVTLISGRGGTVIYADGVPVKKYGSLNLAAGIRLSLVRSMVLGNSASGDKPWQGEIMGLAMFDREFAPEETATRFRKRMSARSFQGTETTGKDHPDQVGGNMDDFGRTLAGSGWNLEVPKHLIPLRREWLSWPGEGFSRNRSFLSDTTINLLGFAPLGAALALLFTVGAGGKMKITSLWLPVAVGASLSLFIELNQAFLVSRDSSLLDLLLNTLGSAAGATIALRFPLKKQTGPTGPVVP